jgi:hypothetical protein
MKENLLREFSRFGQITAQPSTAKSEHGGLKMFDKRSEGFAIPTLRANHKRGGPVPRLT